MPAKTFVDSAAMPEPSPGTPAAIRASIAAKFKQIPDVDGHGHEVKPQAAPVAVPDANGQILVQRNGHLEFTTEPTAQDLIHVKTRHTLAAMRRDSAH